jgi:hypothetical protein
MALQPNSGPGLPFWGFLTIIFLRAWIVSQHPNPNLEDRVSVCMTPGHRAAQLYPQALGTHFSSLLRHASVTVGLLFNPGHHNGAIFIYIGQFNDHFRPTYENKCIIISQLVILHKDEFFSYFSRRFQQLIKHSRKSWLSLDCTEITCFIVLINCSITLRLWSIWLKC